MKKCTTVCISFFITVFAVGQIPSFHVTKEGKGEAVLLLPGFSTPASVWNETVKNLKGKHQTHVFTYAGFGGVTPIDTPWYPTLKRDLILYIKNNNLSNVFIIGHSMGGTLAIDIAAALPDKVGKLILVDALPNMLEVIMPGVSADNIKYNTPYNNQVLLMKDEAFRKMAVMMASGMVSRQDKKDTITKWIVDTDRKTYVYGFTDLLKLDLRESLKNVKAKTLVLGATFPTKDIAYATFEKQYANLKSKQIEMASESKHFIMFDQPDWFYKQVNAFLKK